MSRTVRFVLLALLVVALVGIFAAVLFTQGPAREVSTASGFRVVDSSVRAERGDIWDDFDPEFEYIVRTYFLAPERAVPVKPVPPYRYPRSEKTFDPNEYVNIVP